MWLFNSLGISCLSRLNLSTFCPSGPYKPGLMCFCMASSANPTLSFGVSVRIFYSYPMGRQRLREASPLTKRWRLLTLSYCHCPETGLWLCCSIWGRLPMSLSPRSWWPQWDQQGQNTENTLTWRRGRAKVLHKGRRGKLQKTTSLSLKRKSNVAMQKWHVCWARWG